MSLMDYDPNDFTSPINSAVPQVGRLPSPPTPVPFEGPPAHMRDGAAVAPILGDLTPENADRAETEKFFFDSGQLEECIRQAENLRDMLHNNDMALKVVGILSYGLRRSGELLAEAIYKHKMSKVERKRAEAVAALENFGKYLGEKRAAGEELKATDSVRTHYISIDAGVLRASEREAFFEALVSQLDTYKTQFTMSMSSVKAMISNKQSDALISGVATPTDPL
jgi:hypothetical protein